MALYNEVRPQTLSELRGQEDVVKILRKSVATGTLPNAALFIGTRGTGKTTVARILAKMVNCENPRKNGDPCCECLSCVAIKDGQSMDVIELDAASNNSVDDVRKIIELVQYQVVSNKRVVILDECHMLSAGAFNALLKVLEEPPANVLFVLCTTEVHKVPATILSRCRKFQFKALTQAEISSKLAKIAKDRGIKVQDGALALVAKAAKGSMRDAESIFESFLGNPEITEEEVRRVLGFTSEERIVKILAGVADRQPWAIQDQIFEAQDKGESLAKLIEELIEALVSIASVQLDGVLNASADISELSLRISSEQVFELIASLRKTYEAKPENLAVSLLACLVGQSCKEEQIDSLKKEIEMLKAGMTAQPQLNADPGKSPAEGYDDLGRQSGLGSYADGADDDDWDRFMSAAEFENGDDIPFGDDPAPAKAQPKEAEKVAEKPEGTAAKLSNKAMSSLAAAGFILEDDDEDEGGATEKPAAEEVTKKEEGKKSGPKDLLAEFDDLFKF